MAIDTIKSSAVLDGAIATADIADDAVTNAKIGSGAVGATEVASNAVTTAKIASGAVTSAKLDTNIAVAGTLGVTGAITGTTQTLNRSGNGVAQTIQSSGTTIGTIGVDGGDNIYLTGYTGNTGGIYMNDAAVSPAYQGVERDNYYNLGKAPARWKDLYLAGGMYVGGTGSANYLDDYEEGTYTPVLASTGCTFSYSVQLGSYVKIGNLVYLQFNITLSNRTGTTNNTVFIDNIPFLTKNVDNSLYSGGHIGHYFNINLGSGSSLAYQIPAVSTNQIELKEVGDNVGENSIVASELNTNATIRGSVMYRSV
jgi:hypothetical protein